jgi:hypothetical protein
MVHSDVKSQPIGTSACVPYSAIDADDLWSFKCVAGHQIARICMAEIETLPLVKPEMWSLGPRQCTWS